MQRYTVSRNIQASPDLVWRWMADVERWPEWCPTIDAVTLLDRPMRLGARARILQPGIRPSIWVVDAWEPPGRFAWSARHPGIRVTGDHVVAPIDDGASLVTLALTYTGLLAPLMRRMLQRRSRDYLSRELEALQNAIALLDVLQRDKHDGTLRAAPASASDVPRSDCR